MGTLHFDESNTAPPVLPDDQVRTPLRESPLLVESLQGRGYERRKALATSAEGAAASQEVNYAARRAPGVDPGATFSVAPFKGEDR